MPASHWTTVRLLREDDAGNRHWEGGHRFSFALLADRSHFLAMVSGHPRMEMEQVGTDQLIGPRDAYLACQRLVHKLTTAP
jgi:hypothetical protein